MTPVAGKSFRDFRNNVFEGLGLVSTKAVGPLEGPKLQTNSSNEKVTQK